MTKFAMQEKDISDIRIMVWFLRPYWFKALFVFTLLFVYAFFETLSVGALYPFVSRILSKGDSTAQYGGKILEYLDSVSSLLPVDDKLIAASLFLLVLIIFSRIFGIISESASLWYHLRLHADLQNKIFQKILLNQYGYFHTRKHGDLMYIGGEASQSVGEMFFYFPKAGVEFFRIIIITVLLLTISIKFTFLMYLVIAGFSIIVYILSNKIINPSAKRVQVARSNIMSLFSESFSGIRQIKLFDNYKYWFEKLKKETAIARKQQFTYTAPAYFSSHLILSVGSLSTVLAIIYAKLYTPYSFTMIFPIIIVYVGALMRLMPSVKEIAHQWMGLKGLAPRIRITYETLADTRYEMDDNGEEFPGLAGEIRLSNASFSYPTRQDVLKNINIMIPRNHTVAIVGESGSGKSTLADILLRLYVPSEGKIFIDGIDYQHYSRTSWLRHLGIVSQDPFIFHASVKDNIKIGKLNATDEEIIDAARIANAHQFIMELPERYDTIVGDRGMTLSGGQCQRVAIARALIKNPEILILDEATSSLDNISEKTIQDSLREVAKSRTTVVIAHRLSTIEHADKIFVMKQGEIVEEGTHESLLENRSYYHSLYQREKEGEAGTNCI
ncbi:MAG: ABC transporter ATP-binding protein [Proteobacteria bacterium]|nr:ABC transporter ATP-binding protein [Pseudomonadota bacterium]